MYLLKNAFRDVMRSKGRNILIGLIIFIIAISLCIGLSIRQAAENARENTLEGLSITAEITVDRNAMMENSMANQNGEGEPPSFEPSDFEGFSESLSVDELSQYAEASTVEDFYYTISSSLNATGELTPITDSGTSEDSSDESSNPFGDMGQMFGGDMGTMTAGDFSLIGYSGDNAMRDFLDGTSAITEGSVFEEETENYDCIISQELATYNSLSVGDVITLANPNDESETYDLNIVGIYETADTASENGMGGMFSAADPANEIYLSYSALKSIVDQSTTINNNGMETSTAVFSQTNGTYVFANVNDYETFCEEVYDMGLSEDYTVTSADVNSYEQGLVPLDTLSTMAGYFLIVIVAIGVLILVVLNVFSIRERKYEIGVLTAIGMKKSKVAFIFITEILIVTIAAVIIGSGVGAAVSVPVGNALLENQITSQEQTADNQQQAFGREMPSFDGTIAEPPQEAEGNGISAVTEISAAVDGEILVKLLGICVVLAIASAAVSVGTIMRYQPLNILANRD